MKRPDAHAPDGGEKGADPIRCERCGGNGYLHDVAALRARIAELERVIGEIEKWVRGLIAYKPREVAKDDFAYDRLLNEVKRAAKQMKRLTAGALKASVR